MDKQGISIEGDTFAEHMRTVEEMPMYQLIEHEQEKKQAINEILSDPSNKFSENELHTLINSNDSFLATQIKDCAADIALDMAVDLVARRIFKGKNPLPLPSTIKAALNPKRPGCKGGQKHRDKVREIIEREVTKGNKHQGGGEMKEKIVKTENGEKSFRRADVTCTRPDGSVYHTQVGKQTKAGNPIAREARALKDIASSGEIVNFEPYN